MYLNLFFLLVVSCAILRSSKAKVTSIMSIKIRTIVARNDTNHRNSPYHEKVTCLSVLQTTFIIPLASCLGTSEKALLQILASEDEGKIKNCLDIIKSRKKEKLSVRVFILEWS